MLSINWKENNSAEITQDISLRTLVNFKRYCIIGTENETFYSRTHRKPRGYRQARIQADKETGFQGEVQKGSKRDVLACRADINARRKIQHVGRQAVKEDVKAGGRPTDIQAHIKKAGKQTLNTYKT
jgi:hypothetical protein